MMHPDWPELRLWDLRNELVRFQWQVEDMEAREAIFAVTAAIEKQWRETLEMERDAAKPEERPLVVVEVEP